MSPDPAVPPVPLQSLSLPDLYRLAGQLIQAVRPAQTELVLREIVARNPDDAQARFALAYHLLAKGAFEEAWPLYEARVEVPANQIRRPSFSFPEWKGESVSSILLLPEQGVGDQILFARYAALLKARGVAVTMIVSAPLARLFETLGAEVIVGGEGLAVPKRDAWALVGSLPLRLGVHAQPRYIEVPAAGTPPETPPEPPRGIGVVARGNPAYIHDAQRSLPPAFAAELMALPGAVSLQVEDTGAPDFFATAQLIAGLERVIAADTAVANLAAAMGKPTWVLAAHDPNWRWGWSGETSVWYPSVRLFRQTTPGDWRPVIESVKSAL